MNYLLAQIINTLSGSQVFTHATPVSSRECAKSSGSPQVCGKVSGLALSRRAGSRAEHRESG